jgi:hypothetical protein
MGYVMAMGACVGCGRVFNFNPNAVPSVPVNGVREPICRDCVERANPIRIKNGLEPISIRPDAYEPVQESAI